MGFRFEVDEMESIRDMLKEVQDTANGYGALKTCVIEVNLGGRGMYAVWDQQTYLWEITDTLLG